MWRSSELDMQGPTLPYVCDFLSCFFHRKGSGRGSGSGAGEHLSIMGARPHKMGARPHDDGCSFTGMGARPHYWGRALINGGAPSSQ